MKQTSILMRSDASRDPLQQVKSFDTAPQSRGKTLLAKHLSGHVLRRNEAIAAKCADCMGLYVDGRIDCAVEDCPLYPFMPYRGKGV